VASSSPARSTARSYIDVNAGAEEWQKVKDEYNKYIRDPSAVKKQVIHREMPKYVLGQRIDKIKERPSSAFVASGERIRDPTPRELRRYAPWKERSLSPGEKSTTYVGKSTVISVNPKTGEKVRIIDGGDLTFINDDPRDVGYLARKLQSKAMAGTTNAFGSNTPRDVQWHTEKGETVTIRHAQAPGPGYYTFESELDKAIRKWKQQSRRETATGKRCFGAVGAERQVFDVKVDEGPGPGSYEIP